jgi:hypothetical protein
VSKKRLALFRFVTDQMMLVLDDAEDDDAPADEYRRAMSARIWFTRDAGLVRLWNELHSTSARRCRKKKWEEVLSRIDYPQNVARDYRAVWDGLVRPCYQHSREACAGSAVAVW